jgi:hypothetical protein
MEERSKKLQGTTVPDLYKRIIRDISRIGEPTTSRALEALSWIRHSKEQLSERILLDAVGAERTSDILGPCMSLVVLSESNVFQFSHTTTLTKFLDDRKSVKGLGVRIPNRLDLTKRCLAYLDSSEFELLKGVGRYSDSYGFGYYAARYWADHARDVENDLLKGGIKDLFHFNFLASRPKRDLLFRFSHRTRNSTILQFAARTGLPIFCRLCFEAQARLVQNVDSN